MKKEMNKTGESSRDEQHKICLLHMPFESNTGTYFRIGSDVVKKANHMMNLSTISTCNKPFKQIGHLSKQCAGNNSSSLHLESESTYMMKLQTKN